MDTYNYVYSLTLPQRALKRTFDLIISLIGLLFLWWLIVIAWIVATADTKSNGFFIQKRIGRHGHVFSVFKIKTMRPLSGVTTTVTQSNDPRITAIGRFLRKTKIDELPQLWNVLVGTMSFVGPRPDVPGFADKLVGDERSILSLRPGITGPATIKYRNEEEILAAQPDPEKYNREVIFPDKVRENIEYIRRWSFKGDLRLIFRTVFSK